MPTYLLQGAYAPEAWANMIKNPQDRSQAVRKLVDKFGGTFYGCWMVVGDCDVVLIVAMPDEVSGAACMMAVHASGAFKSLKATQLISMDEGIKAMSLAGGLEYKPPAAG